MHIFIVYAMVHTVGTGHFPLLLKRSAICILNVGGCSLGSSSSQCRLKLNQLDDIILISHIWRAAKDAENAEVRYIMVQRAAIGLFWMLLS